MIMSVLGSMTGGEQGAEDAPALAPAEGGPAGASEVKDLGVVGRGKRRVQPVAVGSPPAAQTQKRSLESLLGGACETMCEMRCVLLCASLLQSHVLYSTHAGATPASDSNPFANVVPSGTPAGLTGSTPLLPVVKKLKIEVQCVAHRHCVEQQ